MLGNIALVNCEKLLKIALKPYRLCACLHTFLNLFWGAPIKIDIKIMI